VTDSFALETPRLALVPLAPPLVAALVEHDLDRAARLAPFPLEESTFEGDAHVLRLRHAQLSADPSEEPWLLRAAIDRATRVVVGKVGFHAPPAADGSVEIGYRVGPPYRRQGYAKEMAGAMLWWAAAQGARSCVASVRPDNAPSLAIIHRLGFERTGEQVDEIDGLEWIFTLPLDTLPSYEPPR
jgi:RimJ/RimL family protein N-acetyltransferase